MRNKQGKWILREVLNRYIPEGLTDRPKKGFGIPLDDWLKGELRDWAESLLDETTIRNQGYLDAEVVSQKWAEHKSGTRRWHYYLWDVLMFQSWLSEYHSS
jgi:asparagine synthase (glutamine-hydrolysing)